MMAADLALKLRSYTDEVRRAVLGRWPQALADLGIDAEYLRNRHGPCPGCGGKDRFRFDDRDGRGSFVCGQGGDTLTGDGFALVMHVERCDFRAAVQRIGDVFGIELPDASGKAAARAVAPPYDRERIDALKRDRETEAEHRAAEARNKAAYIWRTSPTCAMHQYLSKKGIQAHGARVYRGLLVVPLWNANRQLQSLEFISADGGKKFLRGGRVKGSYFAIGKPGDVVCIAEGFATAASIFEATGHATACAFSAGNLQPVAEIVRAKFQTVRIVICADDDHATPGNPGLTKARQAAQAIGGFLAVPDFAGAAA